MCEVLRALRAPGSGRLWVFYWWISLAMTAPNPRIQRVGEETWKPLAVSRWRPMNAQKGSELSL